MSHKVGFRTLVLPLVLASCLLAGLLAIPEVRKAVRACGPGTSLREYLYTGFWQPMYYTVRRLTGIDRGKPEEQTLYAGFLTHEVPSALRDLREAYHEIAEPPSLADTLDESDDSPWGQANQAAVLALAAGKLFGQDLDEARLIDCKIAMRAAERNPAKRSAAQDKLKKYISETTTPVFVSEARGWLARLHYLQKEFVPAVKIYLDEIDSSRSAIKRETLITSLRWAYASGEPKIWDRVEEFFDTARHALFIINLITNQGYYFSGDNDWERKQKDARGRMLLDLLHGHPDLFQSGSDSEELAMASMRIALFMGDPVSTLRYAAAVSKPKILAENPEYHWMSAVAYFVQRQYAQAEKPLLAMLRAGSANGEDRQTAANALIGVYLKTDRPAEALHMAFLQDTFQQEEGYEENPESARHRWCGWMTSANLYYLLDVQLSDEDLLEYLRKYPKTEKLQRHRDFPADQLVRYTLAVRQARREEYDLAAKQYAELGYPVRAHRMQTLAGLLARTKDAALSKEERLKEFCDYGAYIAANQERLYFNDLVSRGWQRYLFLEKDESQSWSSDPRSQPGLTALERQTALNNERKLRDEQEERWKAYRIFEKVANESENAELRRKAILQLLDCLVRINVGRFGRGVEIRTAISDWKRRLRNIP